MSSPTDDSEASWKGWRHHGRYRERPVAVRPKIALEPACANNKHDALCCRRTTAPGANIISNICRRSPAGVQPEPLDAGQLQRPEVPKLRREVEHTPRVSAAAAIRTGVRL
jgi:hypothetical protein